MNHDFLCCRSGQMYRGETPVLLRGFGLGGWLLPEGYMWQMEGEYDRPRRIERLIEELCGPEYAESFWKRYQRRYITQADIGWIADRGFNSVRLPINARRLFRFTNGAAAFVPDTLEYIDQLIAWCKKRDVYVILDMHAAPGGQTGQNIDDSADDQPRLFMEHANEDNLCAAWELLARRYADEPAVAAYDLLNEPLPDFFNQYNDRILPLYRRLIARIRSVDARHMIMLEGAHWATDFSVLSDMDGKEALDNIALQFHRYWSPPDAESLEGYMETAKRLGVPLYLGESGENNLEWYTAMFPLCERLGIGWSFWSYKKMACKNSPVSFARPEGWSRLMEHITHGAQLEPTEARCIFDEFLDCVGTPVYNETVICALTRVPPFVLPCEAFDESSITSERIQSVHMRMRERASLVFCDGHTGEPDYKRLKGEPQPESENIAVRLYAGDSIGFSVNIVSAPADGYLTVCGDGAPELLCNGTPLYCELTGNGHYGFRINQSGKIALTVRCVAGWLDADLLEFR